MSPYLILGVAGCLAVVVLLIGIVVSIRSERTQFEERLGTYVERDAAQAKKETPTPLTDWLTSRVEKSSYGERISKDLARADLKLKPGEYIAVMFIAAVGVAVIAWYIGRQSLIFGAIGAVGGFFLPRLYVKSQQSRRLIRFSEQLPDMLNLMVNGLRAGYSTMQAMEAISKELPAPICDEFRRVVQEMQLGVTMERALDNLLRRIPSDDLDLVITAVNVQREVGGNLAEILDTISYTIRERVRIKGEIRVLVTQQLYSGRILSLFPVFVILILYVLNREYMMEFFKNGLCGYMALIVSGILIISGYFVMTRIANIEV